MWHFWVATLRQPGGAGSSWCESSGAGGSCVAAFTWRDTSPGSDSDNCRLVRTAGPGPGPGSTV